MAQKKSKPFIDFAVFISVRVLVCLVQALPMSVAFAIAELLAKLAYRVDRRHRMVAAENLRHAFPNYSPEQIDTLVRKCYRHFCLLVIEIMLLPRKLKISNWRSFAGSANVGALLKALVTPRPLLIVTAHLGNWELAGYILGVFGFRTYAIARVLDNPRLEAFLKQFRQATGQTVIAKKDDFDRLDSVLRSAGKVATLADQDAGPRGVFVDFFGRPASAHKAVALMGLDYKATMMVVGVVRVAEPMQYCVICEDVIEPGDYENRPDAVKAITQRYHLALERLVRRYPEQYFWLHRRWKTTPAVKKTKAA